MIRSKLFRSLDVRSLRRIEEKRNLGVQHYSIHSKQNERRSADLGPIYSRLLAFHRATIQSDKDNEHLSIREAESQAKREWKWLVDSIKDRKEDEKCGLINGMVNRLINHEPLAYVLGDQPFGPLTIQCRRPTLIPRIETECLTEHVFDKIKGRIDESLSNPNGEPFRILDICCGSGCIALLLRHRILEIVKKNGMRNKEDHAIFEIFGIDIAQSAIQLSNDNLKLYNEAKVNGPLTEKHNDKTSISFHQLDVLKEEDLHTFVDTYGPFDVIICNPPYIPAREWQELDKSVREWEDIGALIGNKDNEHDGLLFYRRLARLIQSGVMTAKQLTGSNLPLIAVEVGHDQAKRVEEIFVDQAGIVKTVIWTDPFGVERAVIGQIPNK